MEDPDRSTIPNLLAGQDPNGAEKNEPAAIEKTPTRHIEDRNLPGNIGWLGRVSTAVDAKWLGAKTWATTLPGRFSADHHARMENMYDNRAKLLQAERMRYAEKAMDAKTKRMALGYEHSFLDRFKIGQWLKDVRTGWYSWREQRNDRQAQIKAAALTREVGKRDRAGALKSFTNKKITGALDSAERRLNARVPQIELLEDEANGAVERLGNQLSQDAEKSSKLLTRFEQVKQIRLNNPNESKEERVANDTLMEKLYGERMRMENRITNTQAKLDRCYHHLKRLEKARNISAAASDRIQARYTRYAERAARTESADATGPTALATEISEPDFASLLAEDDFFNTEWMETEVTPVAFVRAWNIVMPGMKIESPKDLLAWWETAVSAQQTPPPLVADSMKKDIEAGRAVQLTRWSEFLRYLQGTGSFKAAFDKAAGSKSPDEIVRRVAIYS